MSQAPEKRTVVNAITGAVRDFRNLRTPDVEPVPDDVRIDNKTCLVTGANSGLGRAAAIELARRGGNMILACRPGQCRTAPPTPPTGPSCGTPAKPWWRNTGDRISRSPSASLG